MNKKFLILFLITAINSGSSVLAMNEEDTKDRVEQRSFAQLLYLSNISTRGPISPRESASDKNRHFSDEEKFNPFGKNSKKERGFSDCEDSDEDSSPIKAPFIRRNTDAKGKKPFNKKDFSIEALIGAGETFSFLPPKTKQNPPSPVKGNLDEEGFVEVDLN